MDFCKLCDNMLYIKIDITVQIYLILKFIVIMKVLLSKNSGKVKIYFMLMRITGRIFWVLIQCSTQRIFNDLRRFSSLPILRNKRRIE